MKRAVLTAGALAIGLCLGSAPASATLLFKVVSSDVSITASCHDGSDSVDLNSGGTQDFECNVKVKEKVDGAQTHQFTFNCQIDWYYDRLTVSDDGDTLSFQRQCIQYYFPSLPPPSR